MTTETKDPEVAEAPAEAEAPAPATPGGDTSGKSGKKGFERVALPVLLPIVIVGTVLFWVLNLSRILLATDGTGAVVAGAVITVVILLGAAAFSAASKLRSSSMGMIVAGFCALVLLGGLVTISAAEDDDEEGEAPSAVTGPAVGVVDMVSGPGLAFNPSEVEAPFNPDAPETIIQINLTNDSGTHTFLFEDATVTFEKLSVSGGGATDEGKAAFPAEGDFVFYCDVPGHRAGGMEGVLTITSALEPQAVEEGAPAA